MWRIGRLAAAAGGCLAMRRPDAARCQTAADHHATIVEADLAEADLAAAARRIRCASRVVAFTGAGISAESGISTYRDAVDGRGLWDGIVGGLGMLIFGTPIGFRLFPETAWRLYCERLLLPISRAAPNAGHEALAELDRTLDGGLPVITQNVDGLHQRAGSRQVLELHGSVATHRHAWSGRQIEVGSDVDPARPPERFTRPDVVLFFEGMGGAFWRGASLAAELGADDVMIVVGTSCEVAPAGTLPYAALSNGAFVIEVNPQRCLRDEVPIDPGDDGRPVMEYGHVKDFGDRQIHLAGRAGSVLPALAARVRALGG